MFCTLLSGFWHLSSIIYLSLILSIVFSTFYLPSYSFSILSFGFYCLSSIFDLLSLVVHLLLIIICFLPFICIFCPPTVHLLSLFVQVFHFLFPIFFDLLYSAFNLLPSLSSVIHSLTYMFLYSSVLLSNCYVTGANRTVRSIAVHLSNWYPFFWSTTQTRCALSVIIVFHREHILFSIWSRAQR